GESQGNALVIRFDPRGKEAAAIVFSAGDLRSNLLDQGDRAIERVPRLIRPAAGALDPAGNGESVPFRVERSDLPRGGNRTGGKFQTLLEISSPQIEKRHLGGDFAEADIVLPRLSILDSKREVAGSFIELSLLSI